jgi:Thrombospondin type 3 repeat
LVVRWVALVALLLALAGAATARADGADEMFGVNVNRVFNDDFTPAHWDAPLSAVRAAGLRQARSDAFWMWAEAAPPVQGKHTYSWSWLDAEATAIAQHDLRWQPVLDYSALWAASDQTDYHSPPTSNDDYAAYARAFAARYGRGGTFWATHPKLVPLPVTVYEIWNEPDIPSFWRPRADPATYADMYIKARAAIHEVDPAATVLVGGIGGNVGYVRAMYAARPELAGNVDAVGWHAYGPSVEAMFHSVRALRLALDGLGETAVPIRVTELGWPTSGTSPITLADPARAAAFEVAVDTLARSDCRIDAILPYTWTTPESDPASVEDWYGIVHPDGSSTPTSDALEWVVARWASEPVVDGARARVCYPPDADRDGVPDAYDPDDDNDGVPDAADAFPLDPKESADLDGDGVGDNADPDDDGDGRIDAYDAFPRDAKEVADSDLDGIGDNADPDDDNDGVSDRAELRRGTSTVDRDTDDDGIPDGLERKTNPRRADTDRDGIPDGVERGVTVPVADPPGAATGTDLRRFRADRDPKTRTSAVRRDTDRDGLADGREDRNRNGRRDRGESDPLKRSRH